MAYTATWTGSGEATLVGLCEFPEYAIAHVTEVGPQVRTPFDGNPHLVTRVGFFQLGDLVDLGFGEEGYWNDPIWINGLRWQWQVLHNHHMANSRVRWYVSPGSEVYIELHP